MAKNGIMAFEPSRAGFTYTLSRFKPRASEKMGASEKMRGLITNNEDLFLSV